MIVTRLIKHGIEFHAIIQDKCGKVHHRKFTNKVSAIEYIESYYHDHKRIVNYEV